MCSSLRIWSFTVTLLLTALTALAATNDAKTASSPDANVSLGPPGKWVVPLKFERPSKGAQIDPGEEFRWLLQNRQINGQENESFAHIVRQILTSGGVKDGSQLRVEFDPSYQNVVFHWVRLWRGTNSLNRLALDKIRVIQQERELDANLLSGEKTAVLLLEDVRAGDIVDYAFTIRGSNVGTKFSAAIPAQLSYPVDHLVTRLLWPAQQQLYQRNHGTTLKSVVLRKGNFFEFTWDAKNVPGIRAEDSVPSWYDPLPWIQMSAFQRWADVNQWAMTMFKDGSPLSPELKQKIAEWKRIVNKEERVTTALQFLQDEVRYLGIEVGVGAVKPSSPSTVFSQRFGDCKDKTMLLVTILRALGIEAYPVLVHTRWRQTLYDWLPSTAAFDHAITQVRLNGQLYWLDATATYERGPLAARYWPNYGRGLVVAPGTTALAVIPQCPIIPSTTVNEYFQVRMRDQPADLKVVTVAQGPEAEVLREEFARTSRAELEKSYLNSRAAQYSSIRSTAPLEMIDDQEQNRVTVTEYYTIDRMWTQSGADSPYRCHFSPRNIVAMLDKPAVAFRTMPLSVRHPERQVAHQEIILPGIWPFDDERHNIQDSAFTCRITRSAMGYKLTFDYDYETLSDFVPPTQVGRYVQHVNEALQNLGYYVTWP